MRTNGHRPTTELPFMPPAEPEPEPEQNGGEVLGTLMKNGGGETMLIPESDLQHVDQIGRDLDAEESPRLLMAHQSLIEVGRDENGNLLLRQDNWPDDDPSIILVKRDYEQIFLDALCDFLGVQGVGGPRHD